MRLSKQTGYAFRLLIDCVQAQEELITVAQVARRHRITEYNLFKTLPLLVKAGFVTAQRGRSGGLRLARPADEIRLGDVVRATETTNLQADCTGFDPQECAIKAVAPINRIFDDAFEAFIEVLNSRTLAELAAGRPAPVLLDDVRRPAAASRRKAAAGA